MQPLVRDWAMDGLYASDWRENCCQTLNSGASSLRFAVAPLR